MQAAWPVPIIDQRRCDGCGICLQACAHQVLALRAGVAVVARPEACTYDGLCAQICPQQAITLRFELVLKEASDDC